MKMDTNQDAGQALGDLLENERQALIRGDLEGLADMLTRKEQLIDALAEETRPDPEVIRELDRQVKRNQLLLNGAMEGIRAVTSRMAEIQAVKGPLETYGADGKRRDIVAQQESSVERRA